MLLGRLSRNADWLVDYAGVPEPEARCRRGGARPGAGGVAARRDPLGARDVPLRARALRATRGRT